MICQPYQDVDLFYSGDLLVAFCDEFGKAFVSIQPSNFVVERHKRIWQQYLNAAFTSPERFDDLLMDTLRRNHVPEVDLPNWYSLAGPNKYWQNATFVKYAIHKIWKDDYKPIVDLKEKDSLSLSLYRRDDAATRFYNRE